jgi:PIN domain nuclease of toxin-antitoxin system
VSLLLDTHIWLWSLLSPERLDPSVASALTTEGTRLWLSPLSLWEASLLIERGRVVVEGTPERWLRDALASAPVEEAPVTSEVAFRSRSLKSAHRDPVDRFLAATAEVFELTLVTADQHLLAMRGLKTLANGPRRRRRTTDR